MQTESKKSQL